MGELEVVVKKEILVQGEKKRSKRTAVSKVEAKALYYIWALGIHDSDPPGKRFQHMSVAECAMPFRRKGLPDPEMLSSADYMGAHLLLVCTLGLQT